MIEQDSREVPPGRNVRPYLLLLVLLGCWLFIGVWWRIALNSLEKVHFRNDVLYLPKRAGFLAEHKLSSNDCPAYKFDGAYPDNWPAGLQLPPDSYLLNSASLTAPVKADGALSPVLAHGFFESDAWQYVVSVHEFARADGWKTESQSIVERAFDPRQPYLRTSELQFSKWLSRTTSGQMVITEKPTDEQVGRLHIDAGSLVGRIELTLYEFKDMDGWVYFELAASSRKAPSFLEKSKQSGSGDK